MTMNAVNLLKQLLFNPVIVIALIMGFGISVAFDFTKIAANLFMIIAVYPFLWKMADASWGERVFLLIVMMILLLVIF